MKTHLLPLLGLLLLGSATSANAASAARCLVVIDNLNFYYSEPFAVDLPADTNPLFADLSDLPQAKNFEAYVRAHHPVTGDVKTHCNVAEENGMRKEGTSTIGSVTFHHTQTGYTPTGG